MSFSETYDNARVADGYERLMLSIVNGNQSLFVSRDEVEAAWTWVDGIIDAWQATNEKPKPYPAGSWGPVFIYSVNCTRQSSVGGIMYQVNEFS